MEDKDLRFAQNPLELEPPAGPIQPVEFRLSDSIQFRCHKDISCFNACCKNIDIILTPYDILRLKKHLGLSSDEFLVKHAVPFEMDFHGMPGFKMRTLEKSSACQFMTEQGCSVYENRPAACRYYPMGANWMRRKDEAEVLDSFFKVKEAHCKGHDEDRTISVSDYRNEQGVTEYDDINRPWVEAVLKKRSAGPTVGKPSERSFQLFQLCSYELDHFRRFINSDSFKSAMDVSEEQYAIVNQDEEELLRFSIRYLRQVLFGEPCVAPKPDAYEKRKEKKKQRLEVRQKARQQQQETDQKARTDFYDEAREDDEGS